MLSVWVRTEDENRFREALQVWRDEAPGRTAPIQETRAGDYLNFPDFPGDALPILEERGIKVETGAIPPDPISPGDPIFPRNGTSGG